MNSDTEYLTALGFADAPLIGEGQESSVYDIGGERVLKLLKKIHIKQVQREKELYEYLAKYTLPFSVPAILEIGEVKDRHYLIEKKLAGTPLSDVLKTETNASTRQSLLQQYLEAVHALGQVTFVERSFSFLIAADAQAADSWQELFTRRVQDIFTQKEQYIAALVDLGSYKDRYLKRIETLLGDQKIPRSLIHGDFWPPNVLAENGRVSAVLDFNDQTCIGDARLDVAGAIVFAESFISKEEMEFLIDEAVRSSGANVEEYIDLYQVYYALQFSSVKDVDPGSYAWAERILTKKVG